MPRILIPARRDLSINPRIALESLRGWSKKTGGKFIALYFTTGSNDVVLVTEAADGSDAVAVGIAVAASGSLSKIETVRAWTPSEFKGIAEKAARVVSAYAPPGK
jgi:uncharacterized protein with GYD domain